MTDESSLRAGSPASRWRKPGLGLAATAVLLAVAWNFLGVGNAWHEHQHRQVTARIDRHFKPALESLHANLSPADHLQGEARARAEVLMAIHAALYNWPFYSRSGTVPDKFAAIADRLDTTNGADLQTVAGCQRLLVMFDEASWTFYDYPWVVRLYEMEAEGMIPMPSKLPKLGERWANDERRKKWDRR